MRQLLRTLSHSSVADDCRNTCLAQKNITKRSSSRIRNQRRKNLHEKGSESSVSESASSSLSSSSESSDSSSTSEESTSSEESVSGSDSSSTDGSAVSDKKQEGSGVNDNTEELVNNQTLPTVIDNPEAPTEESVENSNNASTGEVPDPANPPSITGGTEDDVDVEVWSQDESMVQKSSVLIDDSLKKLLLCPLTYLVFVDPVVAKDGHTYDRAAIVKALARKPISPNTRQPMDADKLYPNRLIREIIAHYYDKKMVKVNYTIRLKDGVQLTNQDEIGKLYCCSFTFVAFHVFSCNHQNLFFQICRYVSICIIFNGH